MRDSEKNVGRADHNFGGQRSTAENETQPPAKAVPDENSSPDDRGGKAVWGSEGSGEAPRDSRRKEDS
jgi:hypothetical protein